MLNDDKRIKSLIEHRDEETKKRKVIDFKASTWGMTALAGGAILGVETSYLMGDPNNFLIMLGAAAGVGIMSLGLQFCSKELVSHYVKSKQIKGLNKKITFLIEKKYNRIEREQSADYACEAQKKALDDFAPLCEPYNYMLQIIDIHLDCLKKKREELLKVKVLKRAKAKAIDDDIQHSQNLTVKYATYQKQLTQNLGN